MHNKTRIVGQQAGFLLGQASQAPTAPAPTMSNPFMTNRFPFMNPSTPAPPGGGRLPFFGGGGGLFQGGTGTGTGIIPPTAAAPGGSGGLSSILQSLFGGNGSLNLPSILSNAQKMIGAVNQAGDVFKNIGPMLQLFKGLNLAELLTDSDEEIITEETESTKKKKRKGKKSKKKRNSVGKANLKTRTKKKRKATPKKNTKEKNKN